MNTYNTYKKYCSHVFLAKCEEMYEKGVTIIVTTKYGKENECIIHNLVYQDKEGYYYYSIVRADGFNSQEWAKRKAEKLTSAQMTAERKSNEAYQASHEGKDFLSLGEPIKIGHHSEKGHRALINRNWNRMQKSVDETKKAEAYEARAEYWERRAKNIDLSMPESLGYYEYRLEAAKEEHRKIKSEEVKKRHAYSLPYAKKAVNVAQKNLDLATKLWGETP